MIVDLTKPLDQSFIPFSCGSYSDPPFIISDWSAIFQTGFRVFRFSLGTQTGTHIDAPAHFDEGGVTLEALSPEHLIGSYFLLDLSESPSLEVVSQRLQSYKGEKIIFIRTPENQAARLTPHAVQKILSFPSPLIVLSGDIEVTGAEPFGFNRLVACAGKFLAENLDQEAAHRVSADGEIFVLPLRLIGLCGSPCRVVARFEDQK